MKYRNLYTSAAVAAVMAAGLLAGPSASSAAESFYAGKTLVVIAGFRPGGVHRPQRQALPAHATTAVRLETGKAALYAATWGAALLWR